MKEKENNPATLKRRNSNFSGLLLFILWPFAAFLIALRTFRLKQSQVIIYMFLILYGLTFVIDQNRWTDSARYADYLSLTAKLPFSDFFKVLGGIYSDNTTVDIILPLINFIVSRFTDNYKILFGVFAMIFGYFYLKSIRLLYDKYDNSGNLNALIHLLFFAFIIPIFNITGFRFYAAAWVFFYGAYFVVVRNEKKYFLYCLLSSVIHFSFLSADLILFIYMVIGNRNYIYYPILIASFIIPEFFKNISLDIAQFLGGGIQNKIVNYSSVANLELSAEKASASKWFIIVNSQLILYYVYLVIIISKTKYREFTKGKDLERLFSFTILFLSFVNFAASLPSGGRFYSVFLLLGISYFIIVQLRSGVRKISYITIIGLFPMLLYTAIALRTGIESINIWLFAPGVLSLFAPAASVYQLLFR